ncbi:MAG TPA: NAD(P)/FAD-dependent oxidoreductase [Abditibacteriaceae bacterium]|jgi:flavin-dependent dehydrogenase
MQEFDAIIIGGGPAGATAAATLAMRGRNVVVLEREHFPRYHVGESMMPYCYYTLERLGLIEQMNAQNFTKKYSVQFASANGKMSQPFYFFQHYDHPSSTTWQIWRDRFDLMLLNNARDKGATVHEGMTVREVIQEEGAAVGVRAVDEDKKVYEFRAPMTIDCSGRSALFAGQQKWKVRDPELNKIAIWTYYKGAKRDEGYDEGATTVAYIPDKGWFWYIPLPDDIVSVGVVAEADYLYRDGRDLEAIFQREVKENPWVEEHLAPGTVCDQYRVTAEFSYRAKHCASDGIVLAGDAFGFLDPVFSSGLFLALRGGEMVAEEVDAALSDGDYSAARFEKYGCEMHRGIEAMRRLVYAFYDTDFTFKTLFMARPDLRPDVTDCLIGDLWRDYEDLTMELKRFAKVPEPVEHGAPLVREKITA